MYECVRKDEENNQKFTQETLKYVKEKIITLILIIIIIIIIETNKKTTKPKNR